jgi:hypothetical protein
MGQLKQSSRMKLRKFILIASMAFFAACHKDMVFVEQTDYATHASRESIDFNETDVRIVTGVDYISFNPSPSPKTYLFDTDVVKILARKAFAPPDMVTYDTTIIGSGSTWNMRVTRRTDYFQRTDSTAVFININGVGQVGTNAAINNDYGPHYWLENGWDGGVVLPTGTAYPMFITLQPSAAWPSPTVMKPKVDAILARFTRIKRRAVHVQGFSMGGWAWTRFVCNDALGGPYTYASIITTVFENQGAKPSSTEVNPYPTKLDNFALGGNKAHGGNWFGVDQQGDGGRDILTRVNEVNGNHPGSYYIRTTYGGGGHESFNSAYNPSETFTSSNPEVSTLAPFLVPSGGYNGNVYQWAMLAGDTTGLTGGDGPTNQFPIANAGTDQSITLPTSSASLSASSSSDPDGTISTYAWTLVSGPITPVIATPTTVGTSVTGMTTAGDYIFQVVVTDNLGAQATDQVTVTVNIGGPVVPRDYMAKNVTASRPGGGLKFHLGASLLSGVVSSTTIYAPYINRDLIFGQTLMGGDTIVIHANPNNGGIWNNIETGDFGGNFSTPIVVMADSIMRYGSFGGYWRVGTRDSNAVVHAKFDGLANRLTKNVIYGFRYDRATAANDENAIAVSANLFHHVEFCGFSIINVGVGFFMKKNSSATNPWAMYANYTFRKVHLHDNYLHRINGEGFYIGHTDIAGNTQSGNSGPTIAGDSLTIERNIIDSTEWDGIQISNFGYSCVVRYNVTYRTGTANQSSQQWSIFIGGNTSGKAYGNVCVNGTGPFGALGKGSMELYENFIDSVDNGLANADGIYISQSNTGVPTPIDPLIMDTHDNYISRVNRNAVFHANTSGTMQPGFIRNNIYIGSSGTFVSNASDAISGNTSNPSYDIGAALAGSDPYKISLEVQAHHGGQQSFFDIFGEEENVLPTVTASVVGSSTIKLPTNSVSLTSISGDADGSVTTYSWTKTSGPATFTIGAPTLSSTPITDLVAGTYVFTLTVTDDDFGQASDDITIVVQPANVSPTVSAGTNLNITLPTNSATAIGYSAADSDGSIVTTEWIQTAGPNTAGISSPTTLATNFTGLIEGVYNFRLTVTDNEGAQSNDEIQVTVNAAGGLRGRPLGRIIFRLN